MSADPPPLHPLQQLARDLEAAGQAQFAARLSVLIGHLDPYLLPQMPVSPDVEHLREETT